MLRQEVNVIIDTLFFSFLNCRTRIIDQIRNINLQVSFKKYNDEKICLTISTDDKNDQKSELEKIGKMILESQNHCTMIKKVFTKPLNSIYTKYILEEWKNKEWIYSCRIDEKGELVSINIYSPKIFDKIIEEKLNELDNLMKTYHFKNPLKNDFLHIIESELKKENLFYHIEKNEMGEIISCTTLISSLKDEFFNDLSLNDIESIEFKEFCEINVIQDFINNQFLNQKIFIIKLNNKLIISTQRQTLSEIISLMKILY